MANEQNSNSNLLITIGGIIAIIFVVYFLFFKQEQKVVGFNLPNSSTELTIGEKGGSFKVNE